MKTGNSIYEFSKRQTDVSTGESNHFEPSRLVECPFDNYVVTIKLGENNTFMGIDGIKVKKDFLSLDQKISNARFHDIEEFYKD